MYEESDLLGSQYESKLSDLRPEISNRLQKKGVDELFKVQKYTYKLFVDGAELIVK